MTDPDSAVRLTQDGEVDAIYNGIPDWVYEEEVLGTNTAMHTSPDGQLMLYAQFNDSQVTFKLSFAYLYYHSFFSHNFWLQKVQLRTKRAESTAMLTSPKGQFMLYAQFNDPQVNSPLRLRFSNLYNHSFIYLWLEKLQLRSKIAEFLPRWISTKLFKHGFTLVHPYTH